jgi:hypothetical protein
MSKGGIHKRGGRKNPSHNKDVPEGVQLNDPVIVSAHHCLGKQPGQ